MRKPREELRVRTLTEFVRGVEDLPKAAGDGYWFRGQSSLHEGKLRPSIYRKARFQTAEALYQEDRLLSEFIGLGRQLTTRPQTHWDWYFLMQHFGVPSRLLDWTDNALASLHFAVGGLEEGDGPIDDAVVFALDPFPLMKKSSGAADFRLSRGLLAWSARTGTSRSVG